MHEPDAPHPARPAGIRMGRILGIFCVAGALLAAAAHLFDLGENGRAALAIGGILFLGPVLHWLVRSGRAPWLMHDAD